MPSTTVPVRRLTFDEVVRMYETEIIDERERLELVDGVLVGMSPIGRIHTRAVAWLNRHLSRPDGDWHLTVQDTMRIEGGYLLPDVAIVHGAIASTKAAPTPLLVIEVAQTSHARDAEKAADYARAGVPEYWIVDLVGRAVVVHRDPRDDRYHDVRTHSDGASLPTPVDVPAVDVSALLG